MRISAFAHSLVTTLLLGSPLLCNAKESKIITLSGDYRLSGNGIGCTSLVNSEIILAYGQTFYSPPALSVQGVADDPHDKVSATVKEVRSDHAVVVVTTAGVNKNQICANAAIRWTASR